jgi:hypothetical protein
VASWQDIESHTVAGPRRPLTDFPVQPAAIVPPASLQHPKRLSRAEHLRPKLDGDTSFAASKVKRALPGMLVAHAAAEPEPRQWKAQQVLTANVQQVVDAEAEAQGTLEELGAQT